MTCRSVRILLSALLLTALTLQARAQTFAPALGGGPASAKGFFAIPQGTDPVALTYISDGQMLDHTDGNAKGDNQGQQITGQTFLQNSTPGGLEVHAQLLPRTSKTDVIEFDLYTTYAGAFEFTTTAGLVDPNNPPTPWDVNRINPIANFAQGFRFTATSKNPYPINDYRANQNFNNFFALVTVTLTDPNDPTGFLSSTFTTQGFTTLQTPEPGTIALLSGLCVSGGMVWRRRRKALND